MKSTIMGMGWEIFMGSGEISGAIYFFGDLTVGCPGSWGATLDMQLSSRIIYHMVYYHTDQIFGWMLVS